ncbi:MAG TPA: sugar transferase [bacterium]|nr:sugar transferase [bacterium]
MKLYDCGKRILDVIGSVMAIIIFSPIMLAASVWIKIVSPSGPILADTPPRVGKDKKMFRFYKFRSMIPNAHEWLKNQPELWDQYVKNNYKLDPDPRLIKGAKFIRKSSIDEMPQFINVLKGDMSIVGPRAYYSFEVEEQLKKYPHVAGHMETALSVKPGITGLWQISGRSKLTFEERVELDAKYAQKKSLLYDLMIIAKTPYVVLTGKGAY